MTKPKRAKLIRLPHGATISHDGVISLMIDNVVLNFGIEEWSEFYQIIDDVNVAIETNSVESVVQCPTCNTITTYVSYEEPDEEDIN